MCDDSTSERKPPSSPAKSMNNVSRGKAITQARTRGTTRNLEESIDNDSIASICPDALMLASTAPMPDPTLPARLGASQRRAVQFQRKMTPPGRRDHCRRSKGHKSIPRVERHHGSKRKPGNEISASNLLPTSSVLATQLSGLKQRPD